eukprot:COSAG01_NODE_819_length_13340_cov_133.198172_12_plen_176_part_00
MRTVDFSSVYVASAETDTALSINRKLGQGLHVVMSPGVYHLEEALRLSTSGQVLLGLGLATLIPTAGTPAITVAGNTTGCRVAGLLLQAGTQHSPTLLQWGSSSSSSSGQANKVAHKMGVASGAGASSQPLDDSDYGFIHDVFARVGGPKLGEGEQASAGSMVTIDASKVIGDNM